MNNISKILKSWKTVFTINDIQIILNIEDKNYTRLLLHRLRKTSILASPKSGIFVLSNYDLFEFASKIRPNSYIWFETVLQKEWIIFQNYENSIFLASNNSVNKNIWEKTFIFRKLSNKILYNPTWIINYKNKYMIASPERAVCDMVYLTWDIYFDNIKSLSMSKLEDLECIYNHKTALLIKQLIKNVESTNT